MECLRCLQFLQAVSLFRFIVLFCGKLAFFEMLRLSVRRQVFFFREERRANKNLFPFREDLLFLRDISRGRTAGLWD